jgi:2',3'-cyclic-nucleotide 2'-phosphodiesterase (5'-nucleotidase family)
MEHEPFEDIDASHPYYQAIHDLSEQGAISGYPDGEFKLGAQLTRAEASAIITSLVEVSPEGVELPFTDVKEDVWYTNVIKALYGAGIISGYEDDTFKPGAPVTRAEFSSMIVNAFELTTSEDVALTFEDVKADVWYTNAIEILYAHELVNGVSEDTFAPHAHIKRGDATWLTYNVTLLDLEELFSVQFMHTSDTHAHLDDIARRVTAVDEYRATYPDALLLDSGDVFSGTLYFNEYLGLADLWFMNHMGYDAMTLGNHEFDLGADGRHDELAAFIAQAEFPFLSANIDVSNDPSLNPYYNSEYAEVYGDGELYKGIVVNVNGEDIGIFGLTTEDTANISSPEDVAFTDYIAAAEEAVAAFEAKGIDKVVSLSHIGYDDAKEIDNDLELAAHVDGIDIILGGHSHSKLEEAVVIDTDADGNVKEPTVILHSDQYGNVLGTLEVDFNDEGVIVDHSSALLDVGEYDEDATAKAQLDIYQSRISEIESTETGAVATEALENPRTGGDNTLPSVRKNETGLGNLITDGMLAKAKEYDASVIMAMQNGGGIRAAIDAGPITVGEVITVLPFGNTLATMTLTGAELYDAFEHSLSAYPSENGGFLHVAGAKVVFDSSKEAGSRVESIEYEAADGSYVAIEETETYTVATNAFTAKGGDGYDMFATAYEEGRVSDLGLSDWENFRDHLASLGDVTPTIEGRITDLNE